MKKDCSAICTTAAYWRSLCDSNSNIKKPFNLKRMSPVFPGVGVAHQKAEEKKPITDPVIEQKAERQQISGNVTKADPKTNTFTVKGEDVEVTLSNKGPLPKVGQKITITIVCKRLDCTRTTSW